MCVLLARSIFYYTAKPREDRLLRMRIHEIANTRIRFGFRRICTLLRREDLIQGKFQLIVDQ
jgi:putative transposase